MFTNLTPGQMLTLYHITDEEGQSHHGVTPSSVGTRFKNIFVIINGKTIKPLVPEGKKALGFYGAVKVDIDLLKSESYKWKMTAFLDDGTEFYTIVDQFGNIQYTDVA